MPYTFGRNLLGLAFADLENTQRDDAISICIAFGHPGVWFAAKDHRPARVTDVAYGLTDDGFQRSRQVGLGSAVGAPCAAGIPVSGSMRKTVTLCERSLAT